MAANKLSFQMYCKIAGIDSSKTSEKEQSKKFEEMKGQSLSDIFGSYGGASLDYFTVNDLKDELKAQGLSYQGSKADLISRLGDHFKEGANKKRKSPERDQDSHKSQKTHTNASASEVDLQNKNPGNVAGGYKATLKNPNASEEAKDNAKRALDSMGEDERPKTEQDQEFDLKESLKGKNKGNVIGGYKATLHNPQATDSAKQHAEEVLSAMDVDPEEKAEKKNRSEPLEEEGDDQSVDEMDTIDKDNKRVIGGYKATLHNPNSSEEAKEHAKKILKELGVDPEEKVDSKKGDDKEKNPGNVIGGYKAAAHNPNLSKEAQEEAKKHLKDLGVDADEKADTKNSHHYAAESKADLDLKFKHKGNVIGGYRATLHNPASSDEVKDHAKKMLEEMGVDPEGHADAHASYEKSSDEIAEDALGKNPGNVVGGYRATIHNPNASDEAKDHARKMLEEMGVDPEGSADSQKTYHKADTEGKNFNNVAGGYKATIHNPNASDEAKQNAEKQLEKLGVDADEKADSSKRSSGSTEGKNPNNVAGGFKATLKNPNASDDAKEHAQEKLEEMGVDADAKSDSSNKRSSGSTKGKNPNNVAGGFKATLHNANASDEAKEHAQEKLGEMGVDADEKSDSSNKRSSGSTKGKNPNNVAGGFKATLHNSNASDEAKEHAQEKLDEMGVDADSKSDSSKRSSGSTKGKNPNNVAGGFKATLKNPNASDEAKEHAEEKLEEMGVDADAKSDSSKKSTSTKKSTEKSSSSKKSSTEGKNPGNVIGGLKSTLKNPNVSEEAKDHAKDQLKTNTAH